MSRCWGLAGVLFVGCAGGGMSIERYCDELAVARCEEGKRCGYLSRSADCSGDAFLVDCLSYARSGLAAGTLKYDALAAQTCLDDISIDTTCGSGLSRLVTPVSCQNVVTGTGKEGEACGTCAAGLACVRSTDDCGICQRVTPPTIVSLPGVGEHCDSPAGDGAGCKPDAWCGGNSDAGTVCVPSATVGESCMNAPCVRGASCVDSVCVAKADLGASCGAAGCLGGLVCINEVCAPQRKLGAACGSPAECWSSMCIDGLCSRGRQVGQACQLDAPCQFELMCTDGTCVKRPGNGEACVDLCAGSAFCNEGTCVDFTVQVCR